MPGGTREVKREQRASARVHLAQVRIPLSRDVTCQPVALKIAIPVENVAGGGAGLETLSGHLLGPWALVVLSLARSPGDLCLEWLRWGLRESLLWGECVAGLGREMCLPGLGLGCAGNRPGIPVMIMTIMIAIIVFVIINNEADSKVAQPCPSSLFPPKEPSMLRVAQ